MRSIEAEAHKVALVICGSLAFKTLHQLSDQFIVAGKRQFDEIVKSERRVAERRIDTPIGYILLKKVLKETARGLYRRAVAWPNREMNWDRLTAAKKQLVVGLAQKLRGANARRGQHYQSAPVHQPRGMSHDFLQLRIAAHKIVSVDIGEYALLGHQSLFRINGWSANPPLGSLVRVSTILAVTLRVIKRPVRGAHNRLG